MNNLKTATVIIPGCKMGAKAVPSDAEYIKVKKDWVGTEGGNGSLDIYSCAHTDLFSCTDFDNLSKQEPEGHIVTLCEPCTEKAEGGAIVVDAESGCTLNIFGIYEPG